MIIAITVIIAIVVMKIAATAPPIMTAVLSERLWGLEEVVLSGIMTLCNFSALVVGTLGVEDTPGLSNWGYVVTVTLGGKVRVLVRVTVSPATMGEEGEEVSEIRGRSGTVDAYIMKKKSKWLNVTAVSAVG